MTQLAGNLFRGMEALAAVVIGGIVATVAVIGGAAGTLFHVYGTDEDVMFTVTNKDFSGDLSVATTRLDPATGQQINEVFENERELLRWKFNQKEIQDSLEVGKSYQATVYSWGNATLGWERNILSVKEVPSPK